MSRTRPNLKLSFELFLHRQGKAWLMLCLLGGLAMVGYFTLLMASISLQPLFSPNVAPLDFLKQF